jgi:hypothetical protein
MRPELVLLLSIGVSPAVGPEVASRPRTSLRIIDILPDRWVPCLPFLGIELRVPLCKHLLSSGRTPTLPCSSRRRKRLLTYLDVIERYIDSKPSARSERLAPGHELLLYQEPVAFPLVKALRQVTLCAIGHRYNHVSVFACNTLVWRQLLLQQFGKLLT